MGSAQRDRLVLRVRAARWATGVGAVGLTAGFSVAAAHAFKGHDGRKAATATPQQTTSAPRRVTVPGPEKVPSIAGGGSLQPPQEAPESAPQQTQTQPAPAPPVSGGS